MDFFHHKKFQSAAIVILLIIFMIISLWIRSLPVSAMDFSRYLTVAWPDTWYIFRQVEYLIHNFPIYGWFDPMTAYPVGKSVDWGPLYPLIAATLALATGMTSRTDMMYLVSWIGPILGTLMVPVLYFLGKLFWNWKAGIIAAGLSTVTSGLYFVHTMFGVADHHALEIFLATLFCLAYLLTLLYTKKQVSELRNHRSLLIFSGLSAATALTYCAGFLNMPTIILFGIIVAAYTFFQFIADSFKNESSTYLLVTNTGVFIPVLIIILLFGVQEPGFSLQKYSIGHFFAIGFILFLTAIMYVFSIKLKYNRTLYLASSIALFGGIFLIVQYLHKATISEFLYFFSRKAEISTIAESKPWSFTLAFTSFNVFLIFAVIGIALLLYLFVMKSRHEHLFLLVWSVIICVATIQHFRFEYYFAVNIILLASLCIVIGLETAISWTGRDFRNLFRFPDKARDDKKTVPNTTPEVKQSAKIKKAKKTRSPKKYEKNQNARRAGFILLLGIALISVTGITMSVQKSLAFTTNPKLLIDKDWVETMEWLPVHTQDPGVMYFGIYDRKNFTYPAESYGILAWWDYGHYITFIGKRIPNTNPFQDNLAGPSGSAAFFMARSETDALKVLDMLGTRYIVTDSLTATDNFGAVATWFDSKTGITPYRLSFLIDTPQNREFLLDGELPPYFQTMVVRLHNFDGSMQKPETVVYLEYTEQARKGLLNQVVTAVDVTNITTATNAMNTFKGRHPGNAQAIVVGQYLYPLETIPSLQHFRLVYESSDDTKGQPSHDISGMEFVKSVKVFEVVPGARIKGEGIIELDVVTNTGRNFTYRQESGAGEFIVPYSTSGNPYEVKAQGGYRLKGTGKVIEVSEEDVLQGRVVDT